jgi:hypothetical protein
MVVCRVEAFESVWAELYLVMMADCLTFYSQDGCCAFGHPIHLYYHLVSCYTPCPTPAVLPLLHIRFGLVQLDGVDEGKLEWTHRYC